MAQCSDCDNCPSILLIIIEDLFGKSKYCLYLCRMKSGIYKIINIETADFYVGSAKNLSIRQKTHFKLLESNTHNNKFLQNSYNKYGKEVFVFEVLIHCVETELLTKEQEYINKLNPTFNVLKFAGNSLGYKHTKESLEKLKKQDKTHCSKKVYQYDIQENFIKEWKSCSEYARHYKISRIAVIKAIKRSHKCRGFIVSYNPPTL